MCIQILFIGTSASRERRGPQDFGNRFPGSRQWITTSRGFPSGLRNSLGDFKGTVSENSRNFRHDLETSAHDSLESASKFVVDSLGAVSGAVGDSFGTTKKANGQV